MVAVLDEEEDENCGDHEHEPYEPVSDTRLRERMNGVDDPAARQKRSKYGEHEREEDEPYVPHFHHAAFLLHHHGMQERGRGQPRQQTGVFYRVPRPISAPSEN